MRRQRVMNARRSWLCDDCDLVHTTKPKRCRCGNKSLLYFQSKKELKRWQELLLLQKSGAIKGLQRQVKFDLPIKTPKGRTMTHTVDFAYVEGGQMVLEDSKGMDTEVSHMKREMVRVFCGQKIRIT